MHVHVCARAHTHTLAFKELGICKKGPHGLPMITDPRLYFSFLEDNHSLEAEVLGSISKTGRRSVTMRTDLALGSTGSKTEERCPTRPNFCLPYS